MVNPGWQIKTLYPGRVYVMYEIINPESHRVWVGTLDGLETLRRSVIADLNEKSPAPEWVLQSIRQLRDRIGEKLVAIKGGAA